MVSHAVIYRNGRYSVLTTILRSVGSGLTTLLIPIMLANIGYGTFILFACFNISEYLTAILT